MSEKAVTVPVSWMQDKEKQNHPCVQLSNYMSRQVYKQKSVASENISGYFQNNSTVCDLFPEI